MVLGKGLRCRSGQYICQKLYDKGINQNLIFVQDGRLWADAKIAVLLFQSLMQVCNTYIEKKKEVLPVNVLEWMKREGEEFYFYKTTMSW